MFTGFLVTSVLRSSFTYEHDLSDNREVSILVTDVVCG